MIVVGTMSGTSMDGLDVAVADLRLVHGTLHLTPLHAADRPWPNGIRDRLLAVLPPATTTVGELCELDTLIGQATARAVVEVLAAADLTADLVVSHGQTVFHWVDDGRALGTLQLGQPAWIVEATGLPVVSDVRARDVAAGGQGAPLASTLDALWLATGPGEPRRAALNLGGIANVTVVGEPGTPLVAFDTGPANCLLDVAAEQVLGAPYDADGRLAATGTVRTDLLDRLRADAYYDLPAPKSTGRERFDRRYVSDRLAGLPAVDGADLLATLVELTAVTVAHALDPFDVREVVVSGGGVRNPVLLAALRRLLPAATVVTSDERGLPADAKEAYLMALLGFLTWHGLPGIVPGATGSTVPRVLGRVSPGDHGAPPTSPGSAAAPRRLVVDVVDPATAPRGAPRHA